MAKPLEPYLSVVVESYTPAQTSGLHGPVHVRPVAGQGYPTNMHVECAREMKDTSRYPLGTRFRIKAKLTDKEGGEDFLYTSWRWKYDALD